MILSIILLLISLRCQTAYHIQFHPSNPSVTYIPFTPSHLNSASFDTATRQNGYMSYIPLPFFLTVGRKRPFQHLIHNSFFIMLILLSGDTHVNPGPINKYSASLPPPPPPSVATAAAAPPHSPPLPPSAATAAVAAAPPPHTLPLHIPSQKTNKTSFLLCSLNIRSLLHPTHSAEIKDFPFSTHPPD